MNGTRPRPTTASLNPSLPLLPALLLALAWPYRGPAQSLLPAQAIALVGDTFRWHSVDDDLNVMPGAAGPGVLWDQSALQLVPTSYSVQACIEPLSAPHITTCPTSDHVMRWTLSQDPGYEVFEYRRTTDSGLVDLAVHGPVLTYVHEDAELSIPAPLAYGDTVSDAFCYTSTGLGVSFHFCGMGRHTVDGEGTLVMPYGAFPGALRVHSWSYSVADNGPDTSFVDIYRWWVPGVRWPLLRHSTFTATNGSTTVTVNALNGMDAVGVAETAEAAPLAAPNPFTDRVRVQLPTGLGAGATLTVQAPDGRVVHRRPWPAGSTAEVLDGAALPGGLLIAHITTPYRTFTLPLIHQR